MSQLSLSPKETTQYIENLGREKTEKKISTLLLQGIMAGAFIAFGAIAFVNILSGIADPGIGLLLAAAVFPVGIMAILLLGYELFTSNIMAVMGVYNKKYKFSKVLKMLLIVWVANLIGSVLIAVTAKGAGIFTTQMAEVINRIAQAKVSMTYWEMLLRGILCNMLVCAGVMMALTSKDTLTKIIVIWLPIVVFILVRGEHIVANMFFLPMGYLMGAGITIADMAYSFLFVTIGNYIGGAIVIGGVTYLTQLKK